MTALRVPPGRAGRLWLRDRLQLAEHGLSLLERKLTLFEAERTRLRQLADTAEAVWHTACREARTWQLRAELLGGQHALRLAAPRVPAGIVLGWTTTAGLRYPGAAEVTTTPDSTAVATNTTTALAAAAHRVALGAAIRYAAAEAAVTAVERECAATRVRAQSLRHRRIPDLRAALARVELALEEQERSEAIRLRRALA
jgi:V/A-type H+-transporting ATPase subunit D